MAESKLLERFLMEGNLCGVHLGMSAEQVRAVLGPPEGKGGTSNRYPYPSIYLYGTVELFFSHTFPFPLTAIYWEAEIKGAFRFARGCDADTWPIKPEMTRDQVVAFLHRYGYRFEESEYLASDDISALLLSSGVYFAFLKEKGGLHSVGINQNACAARG